MNSQIIQSYVGYLTKKKDSELINWPSRCPDLSRIEHIWDLADD